MKAGDKGTIKGQACTLVRFHTNPSHAVLAPIAKLLGLRQIIGAPACQFCPHMHGAITCDTSCGTGSLFVVRDDALPYLALEGVL